MKDVIKSMLEHPFASIFILSAVGGAIADVIRSIRCTGPKTVIRIGGFKNKPKQVENQD